jgi:hypothetical protein
MAVVVGIGRKTPCCTGDGALTVKNAEKQGFPTIFDRHLDEPVFAEVATIAFRGMDAGRPTAQVVGRMQVAMPANVDRAARSAIALRLISAARRVD